MREEAGPLRAGAHPVRGRQPGRREGERTALPGPWVVETFVELADTLVAEFDLVDLLSLVSERSVELLDAAEGGLLLTGADNELHVMASSSERMHDLELFEIQRAEGPCLEVLGSGRAVVNASLDGTRWPHFAPRARAAGYQTVHALPMRHNGKVIGVINLFANGAARLSQGDVAVAQAMADIASFAIVQDRALHDSLELADQLHQALQSRVAVEQAKGILSERLGIGVDAAFHLLRSYARNRNERIADVARLVVGRELCADDVLTGARATTSRRSPRRYQEEEPGRA